MRVRDTALLDFLNIFNHRLISLFYKAWEKNHFTVAYERDRNDPRHKALFSLIGFGTPGLRAASPWKTRASFITRACSACCRGRPWPWRQCSRTTSISRWKWSRLSERGAAWESRTNAFSARSVPESTMLGFGAVVGDEVWDQQSRVRLKLGP